MKIQVLTVLDRRNDAVSVIYVYEGRSLRRALMKDVEIDSCSFYDEIDDIAKWLTDEGSCQWQSWDFRLHQLPVEV